jgi:hypothetical protein
MEVSALNISQFARTVRGATRRLCIVGMIAWLTACGGGGSTGSSASTPTGSLSWGLLPPTAPIEAGTETFLLPTYLATSSNPVTATLEWTAPDGTAKSQAVTASGTRIPVSPTISTVYTLKILSQDATTIRPQDVATTFSTTVLVNPAETPTRQLTADLSTITLGGSANLTATFSWAHGAITKSVINDGVIDIPVTSGVPIVVKPTQNTTYTLKLDFVDDRIIAPAIKNHTATTTRTILVTTGPGKVSLGGAMTTARSNHVAVQLPNNLVLVAGGSSGSSVLKSTELYDPVKNTWAAIADMGTARTGHTATLLLNGKVLVTGGFDGTNSLKTAEIFDPASGKWAATTGSMTLSHNFHTASLLSDGKVLIAGGVAGPSINADATATEIYDPALGTFAAGPNLPEPRQGHTSTILANGTILFAGNSNGNATTARLLNYTAPATFAWPDLATPAVPTGAMINGRWNHAASLLANGKVLVSGGYGTNPKSTELYNPATNTWASAGTLAVGRALHTSTLLLDGRVLIIGGYDGINALNSIEVYDPTAGTWVATPQKSLNTTRATHTSTLLSNGNVLVVGTYLQTSGSASTSTEVWVP